MATKEIVKILGKGSFGSVDLIKFTQSNGVFWYVARKSCDWSNYDSLNKELQILCKLRGCLGIVQCFGNTLEEDFTRNGNKICRMFMEYASEGTLDSLMDKQIDRRLPDHMIRQFTRTILHGLVSIHSCGYIHCDLKPENILVLPDYTYENEIKKMRYKVKIADFGLAREVGQIGDWWISSFPFWGTPLYMSPESVKEGKIGTALDIWSLGCIVLEMYIGQPPWPCETIVELIEVLEKGFAPEIPETLPRDARMFLETCFARNPEDRLNALVLLSHPFVFEEKTRPRAVTTQLLKAAKVPLQSQMQPKSKPVLLKDRPFFPPGFHITAPDLSSSETLKRF